jgi:hypothetical protein
LQGKKVSRRSAAKTDSQLSLFVGGFLLFILSRIPKYSGDKEKPKSILKSFENVF